MFTITEKEEAYYRTVFNGSDGNHDRRIDESELFALFQAYDDKPFNGRAKRNATRRYCKRYVLSDHFSFSIHKMMMVMMMVMLRMMMTMKMMMIMLPI